MNEGFYHLNGDDDVLLFGSDTFTVSKLKDIINRELSSRFLDFSQWKNRRGGHEQICKVKHDLFFLSVPSGLWCFNEIKLKSVLRECKLLKVGSQGWKEGTIRISSCIQELESNKAVIQIDLEFCPDKPDESLSILR